MAEPVTSICPECGAPIVDEDYAGNRTCLYGHLTAKKFVSPCPPPTPHECELLDILIEECAEVIQRATKMKRFGVQEIQPGQEFTNAQRLAMEFGDVLEVSNHLRDLDLMEHTYIIRGMANKKRQLAKYMQTTPETKA